MKQLILCLFSVISTATFVGCTGPFGSIGRLVPDGSSGRLVGVEATVSSLGSGNVKIQEVDWVGTNGYQIVTQTNGPTQVLVPATVNPARLKLQ